jgi:hypothetical protein
LSLADEPGGVQDNALSIDGKTMRNAFNEAARQTRRQPILFRYLSGLRLRAHDEELGKCVARTLRTTLSCVVNMAVVNMAMRVVVADGDRILREYPT